MKLLEHINRIDHPDRVGSWLATTARNECLRCLTARKRLVLAHEDDILDILAEYGADIDEGLLAQERAEGVRAAMKLLPWRWRRLMELLCPIRPSPTRRSLMSSGSRSAASGRPGAAA